MTGIEPFLIAAATAASTGVSAATAAATLATGVGASIGTAATLGGIVGSGFSAVSTFAPFIGLGLSGMSAVQGAGAQRAAGEAEQQRLNYEAKQGEINAGQQVAASQRSALEQRRQANLVSSRAKALGAASGGSLSDPGFVSNLADIGAEGEYRAMTALYEGQDAARGLQTQAGLKRYEGQSAYNAGRMSANNTLLSGFAGMFTSNSAKTLRERYGY